MNSGTERPGAPVDSAAGQRILAAYRAASAALDEAPSADTRAAILAAAARAAGSRPRPVGEPRRWRLPLAAAASVLAGAIALLIATQVEQPTGGDARGTAAEAVSDSPPMAAPTVAATESQTQVAAQPPPAADPPAAPPPSRGAPPTAKAGPSVAAGGGPRASPQPAASPALPLPPPPLPSRDAPVSAPAAAASAPAAARSAREQSRDSAADAEARWRSTAGSWIERIVELRAAGRHAEADAELAAWRARHPDLRPPAAALRSEQR
jgi:hypothetical protein